MKCFDLTDLETNIKNPYFNHFARVDNIFTASKIDKKEHLEFLNENKIKLAIDLKNKGEVDFDEEKEFAEKGIKYLRLGFTSIDEVDFEKLKKFAEAISSEDGNILVYCMSANRVGAILALYMSLICGHPKKRAIDIASQLGMVRPDLITKVEQILNKGV